jgi:hypothetical protein
MAAQPVRSRRGNPHPYPYPSHLSPPPSRLFGYYERLSEGGAGFEERENLRHRIVHDLSVGRGGGGGFGGFGGLWGSACVQGARRRRLRPLPGSHALFPCIRSLSPPRCTP